MKKLVLVSEKHFPFLTDLLLEEARGNRLLYIPTACYAEGWEPNYEDDFKPISDAGFRLNIFDLEGKAFADVKSALDDTDVVFVGGGNTFSLLKHMRLSGFSSLIHDYVADGVVYSGSSAGAVVASPDISYAASVDNPEPGKGFSTTGLGFIDRPVLPHMDHPDMGDAVNEIALQFNQLGTAYYALNQDQTLLIRDEECVVLPTTEKNITP